MLDWRHLSPGKRFHIDLKVCPASFRDGHEHPLALTAWYSASSPAVYLKLSFMPGGVTGSFVYSSSQ